MVSENRAELPGIPLVWSEAFELCGGTAADMVQQDRWEWSRALRAPTHRVQGSRTSVDSHSFRPASRLSLSHCQRNRQSERRKDERIWLSHSALLIRWIARKSKGGPVRN